MRSQGPDSREFFDRAPGTRVSSYIILGRSRELTPANDP
jgi:hypothetical protein